MKKVLITGANGFLGQHLCSYLKEIGFEIIATSKGENRLLDPTIIFHSIELTNKKEVADLLEKLQPDIIIHNAAMSKPDECENNQQLCIDVNVNSTKYLLSAQKCHFIYLSTDFVFGEDGPHSEYETTGPLNFYGKSKLQSEQLIMCSPHLATIVRPVFMYGNIWHGMKPTFLHWVKNNLEQNKPIKVVSDQWRTPTYVKDVCKGIQSIINRESAGIFHFAGKEILSPYEMAIFTAKVLQLDSSLIEKVTANTFPEPVKRAKRSGLKIDKAIAELNYNPLSFEEGVRKTFEM